jgi:hypothetical protein
MTRKPKITLEEWAGLYFKDPPKISTLRRWAKIGDIHPRPLKVGRRYLRVPDAEYVENPHEITLVEEAMQHMSPRVRRILQGTSK